MSENIFFEKIKKILCEIPSLNNFYLSENIEIHTSASEKAIGCCTFQNKETVHYASRCLIDSEINFAQVEKEMPDIVLHVLNFII